MRIIILTLLLISLQSEASFASDAKANAGAIAYVVQGITGKGIEIIFSTMKVFAQVSLMITPYLVALYMICILGAKIYTRNLEMQSIASSIGASMLVFATVDLNLFFNHIYPMLMGLFKNLSLVIVKSGSSTIQVPDGVSVYNTLNYKVSKLMELSEVLFKDSVIERIFMQGKVYVLHGLSSLVSIILGIVISVATMGAHISIVLLSINIPLALFKPTRIGLINNVKNFVSLMLVSLMASLSALIGVAGIDNVIDILSKNIGKADYEYSGVLFLETSGVLGLSGILILASPYLARAFYGGTDGGIGGIMKMVTGVGVLSATMVGVKKSFGGIKSGYNMLPGSGGGNINESQIRTATNSSVEDLQQAEIRSQIPF